MSVEEFINITGATVEEAQFFLEASGWDLATALDSYLQSTEGGSGHDSLRTSVPRSPPTQTSIPQSSIPQSPPSQPSIQPNLPQSTRGPSSSTGTQKPTSSTSSRRIATLSDFNKSNDDDDSRGDNKYYAGGSATSGQQILGGDTTSSKRPSDYAEEILKKAREAYARGEIPEQPTHYDGVGRRLGSQKSIPNDPQNKLRYKKVKITFYSNGFLYDDNDFYSFSDPKNQAILETINQGYIPRELSGGAEMVDVELEDRKQEEYVPKFKPFSSEGKTLSTKSSESKTITTTPLKDYQCDRSRPYTTLQLRLPSGAVRQEFNLSDTIQTVMNFIAGREPELQNVSFTLLLAIPPRTEFTDPSITLEEAKLQNTALMIKK